MNTTRTDSHRPSAICPDDYSYVACEHIKTEGDPGLCDYQIGQREVIKAHMARTGGTYSRHEHGGNCHVCGSVNLIYSILFYHEPSNSYIRVGEDCAEKLEMGGTREMSAFRAAMRNALEAQAGKRKAQAVLAEAGLSAAWEISQTNTHGYEENIIRDIVSKLIRYGSISVNQGAFIGKLLVKIDERAVKAAQRQAENEAAADFPVTSDRIEIVGEVLTTKLQESDFGSVWKMLVKHETGWKVWVTCPGNPAKGDKVRFFAKLQPSRDDSKFGFGSRPTKFEILKEVAAVEAAPRDEVNVPDVQTQNDNYFA
jgi:hypothetical protein